MNTSSRAHDDAVVELLREDPAFADEYLAVAMDEADLPGGQAALLAALRHVAEAQGMAAVAERAGIPRESLYRALSPTGNPTIKTLLAVLKAAGLKLTVHRTIDACPPPSKLLRRKRFFRSPHRNRPTAEFDIAAALRPALRRSGR